MRAFACDFFLYFSCLILIWHFVKDSASVPEIQMPVSPVKCPSPWVEVSYSLAAVPHELIRLRCYCGIFSELFRYIF